jgi:tetratricopeptide (TPR) repeat protein
VVLLAFVVVFVTLAVIAHAQNSGTWDEPMHLASGYAALVEGNHLIDPSHPPLARMWAALPLLAMRDINLDRAALDRTSSAAWESESYEFARQFVYVRNDANRLLFSARTMVVLWGVALGILLFAWTCEWLGFTPAVIALAFYTLEPNLAAHATLVTTDFGVTCAIFGAVYFLWRVCRRATPVNVAGLCVFTAAAVATKFSGLILVPVVLLVLAAHARRDGTLSMRQAWRVGVTVGLAVYLAVWAAYGFRYAPSRDSNQLLRFDQSTLVQQNAPGLARIAGWIDAHRLLPNAFSQGLLYSQASTRELPAYLAGAYSADGWWYYFPFAFLIKTPVAVLVLFAAGLIAYMRRRNPLGPSSYWFVAVPPTIYLVVAMASGINIGVRHILPIYPFVLIVAAAAAAQWLSSRHRVARPALAALTVFAAVTYAMVYPHTLTFFNRLVGGPANGSRLLSDSNLDWGQHLKLLKKWMDRQDVEHINLAYFGTADPAYYGIDATHLPGAPTFAEPYIAKPRLPGYVAISATVASGVYLDRRWRLFYRPFTDLKPVADVGHSIRVYWVERWPEPMLENGSPDDVVALGELAEAMLFGMRWTDQAVAVYRMYLRYRPDDAQAMTKLGIALASQGDTSGAITELRRAAALDPANGWTARVLAEVLLGAGHIADAEAHAGRAVALVPADPAAHDALGVTLAMRGRLLEAKARFERALELNPGFSLARQHLDRVNMLVRQDARLSGQ